MATFLETWAVVMLAIMLITAYVILLVSLAIFALDNWGQRRVLAADSATLFFMMISAALTAFMTFGGK